MRYIDKSNRLLEWDAYVTSLTHHNWGKLSDRKRFKLHKHLHGQQNGLCIYCEQKLNKPEGDTKTLRDASDVEHVLDKSLFIALIFEQDNLAMSCLGFRAGKYELGDKGRIKRVSISQDFCNHSKYKDKRMNFDLFINPLQDKETHQYFAFDINGEIIPSKKHPEKAKYTIDMLNLNHADLVAWRLEVYNTLLEDVELDITNHLATYPIFYSMVRNLWGVA